MVNNKEFVKRLEKILEEYDLSAAAFAQKIAVGRASISHILSGRNKPSLDFVLKVTSSFPEVDLYWLLWGKGSFPKKDTGHSPATSSHEKDSKVTLSESTGISKKIGSERSIPEKTIKKIVIFYNDNSFESFEN